MTNAKGKSDTVFQAAFRRLVEVSSQEQNDAVARACWQMVHTIEQIRKEAGRKVWRMNRLRPKIENDGPKAALEYCARNRTEGFEEVLSYGLPEFTAEAIVLRMPAHFDDESLQQIARNRLLEAGIDPNLLTTQTIGQQNHSVTPDLIRGPTSYSPSQK